ncbi:hypothetical protein FNU33_22315 [Salmonella enterica]|nr:hypothetical protein [Salmonella enterica]ECD9309405.1 hypothetical protein [Salmonella enterica]
MDINQKFFDDVIITLMEMNDRIVALEEMAAEHVAEHETAIDAFEDGFAAGEKRAISDDEYEPKYSEISLEIKLKDKTKGYIFFDSMDEAREILKLISRYHAGEIA